MCYFARYRILALLLVCLVFLGQTPRSGADGAESPEFLTRSDLSGARGGNLIIALRSEPRTLNRLTANDLTSASVCDLLSGTLVHLNRQSLEIEPALASRWEVSADNRSYTLHLRRGIRFSDGSPFTADDVLFSLDVVRDPKTASLLREQLTIDGVFPEVRKLNEHTIRISFVRPVGTGLRALASVSIVPRSRLLNAYQSGSLPSAWRPSTAPSEIAGLGPFKLKEYRSGVSLVLERNPFYWKRDGSGQVLPYLETVTFLIIPNRTTEALNFQAGQLDLLDDMTAETYAQFRRAMPREPIKVQDLGPGLDFDFLWFNLNPGLAKTGKPYVDPEKRAVFAKSQFRAAVSYALNRKGMTNSILLGLGAPQYGPISPGNKRWHHDALEATPYDPAKSREMLKGIGLKDTDGDGVLEYGVKQPLEILILSHLGHPRRSKLTEVVRDNLSKIGIRAQTQLVDVNDLVQRVTRSFDYEAILFGFTPTDVEPEILADLWQSSGGNHFWYPNQASPQTPWEAEIDRLVNQMSRTPDFGVRKTLVFRLQEIWARELPAIPTVTSSILAAWKAKVRNLKPSILQPHLWWNCEELAIANP